MPYAYVETKYPQWVRQLPSLKAVARIETVLTLNGGHSFRFWVPFAVEDVLTLLDYEEKAYAKATREEKALNFAVNYGSFGSPAMWRQQNTVLLTLPRADLEEQYIIPAIAASQVEGPEPFSWWQP